jgi:opacity protein-like surface antigen
MKLKYLLAALVVGLSAGAATTANATTISVGDGWHEFFFGGVGSSWSDSYSFTLSQPTLFKVTDAFNAGDQFDVTGLGLTSLPTATGPDIGANPDGAYSDPAGRWSHAGFLLVAGIYNITGTTVLSPFGGGGAYVQLVSAVPLPAALPLFGGAMASLGMLGRWRKRRRLTAVA